MSTEVTPRTTSTPTRPRPMFRPMDAKDVRPGDGVEIDECRVGTVDTVAVGRDGTVTVGFDGWTRPYVLPATVNVVARSHRFGTVEYYVDRLRGYPFAHRYAAAIGAITAEVDPLIKASGPRTRLSRIENVIKALDVFDESHTPAAKVYTRAQG